MSTMHTRNEHSTYTAVVQAAAEAGMGIFFHTMRDSTKTVALPENLLDFGEHILPHDNAHFAAIPAGHLCLCTPASSEET